MTSSSSLAELRERQKTRSRIAGVVYKVGDVIAGRYKVKDIAGSGGAGVVYRAHDQEIDVEVGLKVINAKLLQTPDERKLFSKELKAAKKLSHQNIVRIYDEGAEGERSYFTMQFLEGLSLRKIIDLRKEKGQNFRLVEIEPIFNQLCQAFEHANKSTLHGDLKPDNVIVLPDLLKITDFGLLKALPRKPFLAIQKSRGHNLRYLAPEVRLEVPDLTPAVDMYSLGVIIVEMLTGKVYDDQKPDQLNIASSGLDPEVLKMVRRAVARAAKERYGSAAELYDDLRRLLVRPSVDAPAPAASPSMPPVVSPRSEPPQEPQAIAPAPTSESPTEAPTQRLDLQKHGERPIEEPADAAKLFAEGPDRRELTGSLSVSDDMIEDAASGAASALGVGAPPPADPPAPAPLAAPEPVTPPVEARAALEVPPLAEDEVEGEEPTEAVEGLMEISGSQIELISDPRPTRIVEVKPGPEAFPDGVVRASLSSPPPESNPEAAPRAGVIVAPEALSPPADPPATRRERVGTPPETVPARASQPPRPSQAPRPAVHRGSLPPDEGPKAKARPMTRPRMSALPKAPEPMVSASLFGSVPDSSFAAAPEGTGARPLVVDDRGVHPKDPTIAGAVVVAGKDNTKLFVGGILGLAAIFVALFVAFFVYSERQRVAEDQRRAAELEELKKQMQAMSAAALERAAKETAEAQRAGVAAGEAAEAEASAKRAADDAAKRRKEAEEAAVRADQEKRGREAEEKRRQALEAQKKEAEARELAERERQRKEREERAQREATAKAEAERRTAEKAKESERKAREAEEAKKARDDARAQQAAEEAKKQQEEARRAAEESKRLEAEKKAAEEKRKQEEAAEAKKAEEEKAKALVPAEKQCPKGMTLVKAGAFMMGTPRNDPERNFGDRAYASVEVADFCIDYYEAPNARDQAPKTGVTYAVADKACKQKQRRLCTEEEWEKACKGTAGTRFPYGNQWDPAACNTEDEDGSDRQVAKSGTFKKCRSDFNVFDLSGNVAEWTSTEWDAAQVVKGGSADRPGYDARCAARKKKKGTESAPTLGYRCCAAPG